MFYIPYLLIRLLVPRALAKLLLLFLDLSVPLTIHAWNVSPLVRALVGSQAVWLVDLMLLTASAFSRVRPSVPTI